MKSVKISLMILYLCTSLQFIADSRYVTSDQALESSKILNGLIQDLHSNPEHFPNKNINLYVQNFNTFKAFVEQLQAEGRANFGDYTIAELQQNFVIPYQEFYDKIVAHAQEHPTELQEVERILKQVQQDIVEAFGVFSASMEGKIGTLENYSETTKQDFFDALNGAVKTFETKMQSIRQEAREEFFEYEVKLGKVIDPYNPTPVQRSLLQGVHNLAQDALIQVHALALDLTSEQINLDFASQTTQALARYKQEAKDNYQRMLRENERNTDDSWWKGLKDSGSRIIDNCKVEFVKQSGTKLKNEVVKVIKKHGGEVVDQVVKKLGLDKILNSESLQNLLKSTDALIKSLRTSIKRQYPIPSDQNIPVRVERSKSLGKAEQIFVRNRLEKVAEVLENEFNITQPLRLALCCSGGGNRAMVGTLGIFKAAARYNLLQASMYITGLSGSTWTIAPWAYMYLKGILPKNMERSIEKMIENLAVELDYDCQVSLGGGKCGPPVITSTTTKAVLQNNFMKRFAYQQPVSLINLFGPSVSNYALAPVGKDKLDVAWSELFEEAQEGDIPLPLCSCCFDPYSDVREFKSGYAQEYEWIETGPFEAGSSVLGYIPTWAFGSVFKNGTVIEHTPEYPISFLMGVYGSAFALSANDMLYHGLKENPSVTVAGKKVEVPVNKWIAEVIDQSNKDARAHRSKVNHAHIANFSQGLSSSIAKDKEELAVFDGGVYFNLPLPLLFDRPQRAIDVVIMYDSNPGDTHTLIEASRYFNRKRITMPNMLLVTKESLMSRPMTVFNDPRDSRYQKSMPTLIYIPTPKTDITKPPYNIDITEYPYITKPIDNTKAPYTTLNFKYSKDDVYNLTQTMEAVVESVKDQITEIMQLVAQKKK